MSSHYQTPSTSSYSYDAHVPLHVTGCAFGDLFSRRSRAENERKPAAPSVRVEAIEERRLAYADILSVRDALPHAFLLVAPAHFSSKTCTFRTFRAGSGRKRAYR